MLGQIASPCDPCSVGANGRAPGFVGEGKADRGDDAAEDLETDGIVIGAHLSSARARSNRIYARCSPSSASALAGSFGLRRGPRAGRRGPPQGPPKTGATAARVRAGPRVPPTRSGGRRLG